MTVTKLNEDSQVGIDKYSTAIGFLYMSRKTFDVVKIAISTYLYQITGNVVAQFSPLYCHGQPA